jgi:hypothetical protein
LAYTLKEEEEEEDDDDIHGTEHYANWYSISVCS